jgi:hypothetical protein
MPAAALVLAALRAAAGCGPQRVRSCSPTALPSPRQADNPFFFSFPLYSSRSLAAESLRLEEQLMRSSTVRNEELYIQASVQSH